MSDGMMPLQAYVIEHAIRGACRCGRCIDAVEDPDAEQPEGHTADVFFFLVGRKGEPDARVFRDLIKEHGGVHLNTDPLDGDEHGFMELGAWLGDQGVALQFMGLGELLGLWRITQPGMLPIPDELKATMAGAGMVTIRSEEDGDE